jgi:hypothetical protein
MGALADGYPARLVKSGNCYNQGSGVLFPGYKKTRIEAGYLRFLIVASGNADKRVFWSVPDAGPILQESLAMTEQRIDLGMLSRIDSDQKATASRVNTIDDGLRRVEKDVAEIKGILKTAETPAWVRHYVYPCCVLISVAMVTAVIHLEIVVNSIGKNVGGLQVSLARQNLTTYAALPPTDFKAALSDVGSTIAVARKQNVKVPTQVMDDLSKQLNATAPNTSGFWTTAAEFISYRSVLTHEDLARLANSMPRCVDTQLHPATGDRAITKGPNTIGIIPAHYDNCRVQLDSPEENAKLNRQAQSVPPVASQSLTTAL